MLLSISSLGIQKILMGIGTWLGFKVLSPFSMIVVLVGLWVPKILKSNLLSIGYKIAVVSIAIRFALPVTALVCDKIYELFMNETYIESSRGIKEITNNVKNTDLIGEDSKDSKNGESGYLDKLKKMYGTENKRNIEHAVAWKPEHSGICLKAHLKVSNYAEHHSCPKRFLIFV